ncbi:hypothetical protein G9F72_006500 [Clostridium estertheticum]|nr:hypothetical protein [Clostridium estertheticum]MBZ9685984.1 hypothetical protein [Clostridium estertheticum]
MFSLQYRSYEKVYICIIVIKDMILGGISDMDLKELSLFVQNGNAKKVK